MVSQISRFEYIVTDSELEALVLENNVVAYVTGLAKVTEKAVSFEELSKM